MTNYLITLLNLMMISAIVVFIIDLSGAITQLKNLLFRFNILKTKHQSIKPFDCSLCSTWWIGLIYLIISEQISIFGIFITALTAFFTPITYAILTFASDYTGAILNRLAQQADNFIKGK